MQPKLNKKGRSVCINNKDMHLTPKEYGILSFLMDNPNQIFTSEEIYASVWGEEPFDTNRIIAVHLRHIREKMEENPSKPKWLQSYWGRGYSFQK